MSAVGFMLVFDRQTKRNSEQKHTGGHRVSSEDQNYHVAAAPTLPPYGYLSPSLLSHLRLGPPVAPGNPAPEDKEGKRETGRTPEGNRWLWYPGFTYRESRQRRERVQGKENQYSTGLCCFQRQMTYLGVGVKSASSPRWCQRVMWKNITVSFNPQPTCMTSLRL